MNTCSPTTKNLLYTNFQRGDIVNARGQIGVVVDCLKSQSTENACLYISFAHNIGNSRQYDMLELTPQRVIALGVDKWTYATKEELQEAISKRQKVIEKAIQEMLDVAIE